MSPRKLWHESEDVIEANEVIDSIPRTEVKETFDGKSPTLINEVEQQLT